MLYEWISQEQRQEFFIYACRFCKNDCFVGGINFPLDHFPENAFMTFVPRRKIKHARKEKETDDKGNRNATKIVLLL